ncbi:MAG: hypothetical protein ACFB0E_05405 [Leptolyngbyaceae cyanobacterium]
MSSGNTEQALENITDAGLFERLATATLREANHLYQSLVHTGVNAEGKPVKSPVDGICFVQGTDPPHMVAVHHATTAQKDLEKKWLHDPSTVKPRKGSKPTAPAGDLIKTAAIVQQERERTKDLRAVLVLTTNREPSEDLIRNVVAAGRTYDIEIDIWSRSRLSHFLDYQPTGQWIRKSFLNIEQELLSPDLLHELSMKSLQIQQDKFFDNPSAWIPRQLDSLLTNALNRDITFLVAGSGFGKSVACFRQLMTHVKSGGFGFVLSHESIASSLTLEQAVMTELQQLHPSLASGITPVSFCSSEQPLLLVVEDVNQSGEPQALLRKLASWSQESSEDKQRRTSCWQVLCPLWPEIFASLPTPVRDTIQPQVLIADGFTKDEGRDAVLTRSHLASHSLSLLEAESIAHALGHDPLLIALHNQDKTPNANQIIEQFFEDCLNSICQTTQGFFPISYRQAIRALGSEMLLRRKIDLALNEVITWERLQGQHSQLLSQLVAHGKFIRAIGSSNNQRLVFRHDRVRDWLLADAVIDLESRGLLEEEVLSEPYFAEVLGAAVTREDISSSLIERVKHSNPLALFHSLRIIGEAEHPNRDIIINCIDNYLAEPTIRESSKLYLRLEALAMLSETDAPEVPEIARRLHQDHPLNAAVAKFRNGDVLGGIYLCSVFEPGCSYPWRDSQIEHAKSKYGYSLTETLANTLRGTELPSQVRIGALRLSGHFAEPSLAPAIEASWNSDDDRLNHLDEYLWAFAECCADDPERFLGPVCNAWALLSDQPEKEGCSSPRNSLAAYGVRWALHQWPPHSAVIDYFVQRAAQEDLRWPITYMLHGMNHTQAIEFIVHEFAARERRLEGTDFVSVMRVEDEWRRAQDVGRSMSQECRDFLLAIWQDSANDKYLRSKAFAVWAVTEKEGDIKILQDVEPADDIANNILRQRLVRGDHEAIPAWLEKLSTDDKGFWWFYGRYLWSPELSNALDEWLDRRDVLSERVWYEYFELDWFASDLISRMNADEAEDILSKHWSHIRFNSMYVQSALYISTPKLLELAQTPIHECPDPSKMLQYISMRFGVRDSGHPGVRSESQLRSLVPYIHLLSPTCIHSFWQECNDRGWFTTRRELFDDHLQLQYSQLKWEQNQAKASLDEMLERDRLVWLEHWIDEFLKIDVPWKEILSTIHVWFEEKHSFEAFKVLTSAIKYRGSREDLSVLKVYEGMPEPDTSQLIADTEFAVKRRSIV